MLLPRWHLAIFAGGPIARGTVHGFRDASATANAASGVLTVAADRLRRWERLADNVADRARAQMIADRLDAHADTLAAARRARDLAAYLDDLVYGCIPLNTLVLPRRLGQHNEPKLDAPIPFSGGATARPMWMQTWPVLHRRKPTP